MSHIPPESIFLHNYRVMAPSSLIRYPQGHTTLLPVIESCDNAKLPTGPFSQAWKSLRDKRLQRLRRAATPLDSIIPFFLRAPPQAQSDGNALDDVDPEAQEQPIGFLRQDVLQAMKKHNLEQADQPIFDFLGGPDAPWGVAFAEPLNDLKDPRHAFALRTRAMTNMVENWRDAGLFPENLKGWRNERYAVYAADPAEAGARPHVAFFLERSATALFGMATFGVHLNGYYIDHTTHEYHFWISRRSKSKPTWPDCLDNTVAGGITELDCPLDSIIRECGEEASLPAVWVQKNLCPAGLVTYVRKDELDYLFPECQYVYDLTMPEDHSTQPKPNDDEVDNFQCLSASEVTEEMFKGNFKPNCALVLIDFFVRHGLITSETDSRYNEICRRMRRDIAMPGPA